MHNESLADRETEPCRKESKWKKFGPALFWGTVVALPAMNLAASYLGYKDAKIQLELAKLKDIADAAVQQ